MHKTKNSLNEQEMNYCNAIVIEIHGLPINLTKI